MLGWVMRHRWVIVVACAVDARLVRADRQDAARRLPPPDDQAQFEVNMRAPEGTSLTSTRLIAERIAEDMRRIPGVTHTLVTVGEGDQQTRTSPRST